MKYCLLLKTSRRCKCIQFHIILLYIVISSVRSINTISADREINTIFLSSIKDVLQDGYMNGVCSAAGVELLKTSLAVGRQRVVGLKIYALFAVGG